MPAYASHYIFATEMMDRLQQCTHEPLNQDAVFFGTQGPDIFFFHRVLPTMVGKSCRAVGSALHRVKPSSLFDAMATYLHEHPNDSIARSYAYGFLCHYALDRVVHPFVYAIQGVVIAHAPQKKGFTVHNTIEFSLDNVLLNQKMGLAQPWLFDTSKTVPTDKAVTQHIAALLQFVIGVTIPIVAEKRQVVQALHDTKSMQKMTFDPYGIKRKTIEWVEWVASPLLAGYKLSVMMRPRQLNLCQKYCNLSHRVWRNPNDAMIARRESFFDLYERAEDECVQLVHSFNKAITTGTSMLQATGDISFLTGNRVE